MSDLPLGWTEASILELAGKDGIVTDGDWVESKHQDTAGTVRLIQLADIGDGHFINKSQRFMNEETVDRLNCTRLAEGDLLIARMPDPLGRACTLPDIGQESVTAVDVFVWRPDPELAGADTRWLMHTINSPTVRAEIQSKAGGTTRQRVAGGKLKQLQLPLPPLREQQRIAAKVDGLIARTARASKELNLIPTLISRYKQRLLALAFSGELTAGWRGDHGLREPVPTTIDDLSEGLRYGTAQKSYTQPNGVAVLRIPNVVSGQINLENLKYSVLEPKEFAKLRLHEGDVLVVRSNGSVDLVGRPALVTGEAVGLAYAGYLIRIRPKQDVIIPKFLALMLEAPAIRRIIETGTRSTSGVNNVNATELGALTVPLFHIDEQGEIVRRIESAFGWLNRMAADHAAADRLLPKLDAAILAKAFQGKLVPQDPNDEPAARLLERVKSAREAEAAKAKNGRGRKPNRSKAEVMIENPLLPRDRLLKDSEKWPAVGLPFEAIALRNSMNHDSLRDALFELLSGPSPALQQRFDTDAEVMIIQRVAA
jgi:type I restriction enzyme S subunit